MMLLIPLFLFTSTLLGKELIAFLEFIPPQGWNCTLNLNHKFHCKPNAEEAQNDGYLVFGTKYTQIKKLNSFFPKVTSNSKDPKSPKVIFARERQINGYHWYDSFQFNTQIEGFWTRELATLIKLGEERFVVYVNYVLSEQSNSTWSTSLDTFVKSLRIPEKYQEHSLKK